MIVLLLDARWPTMIPYDAVPALRGTVSYTSDVPIRLRWHFEDVVAQGDTTILVSTNDQDPAVVEALASGATLYEAASRKDPVGEAVSTMERALHLGEWEQLQTHETLLPYLAEESEEFARVVRERAGDDAIREELGDLLLQVLFHAEIADRRGAFNFADVATAFVEKLRDRAPYLFDGTQTVVGAEEQKRIWQQAKQRREER